MQCILGRNCCQVCNCRRNEIRVYCDATCQVLSWSSQLSCHTVPCEHTTSYMRQHTFHHTYTQHSHYLHHIQKTQQGVSSFCCEIHVFKLDTKLRRCAALQRSCRGRRGAAGQEREVAAVASKFRALARANVVFVTTGEQGH